MVHMGIVHHYTILHDMYMNYLCKVVWLRNMDVSCKVSVWVRLRVCVGVMPRVQQVIRASCRAVRVRREIRV
jgi:hypothetical protein